MRMNYLFGDSIGQGIYFREDAGRYRRSPRNCVRLLQDEGIPVENHAVMGYTVEKGLAAFRESRTEAGANCVIEFGGNDCDLDWQAVSDDPESFHDGRVPLGRFRETLNSFIREARGRGLTPILVTPPPLLSERYFAWVSRGKDPESILRYLGDVEHIARWQERYAWAVRDEAERNGCRLLDLRREMLEERNLPDLMSLDGIHPNERGYEAMARALMGMIPDDAFRAGA